MRIIFAIGVALCLASMVIQNQGAAVSGTKTSAQAAKKAELKKEVTQKCAAAATNNKPLTPEEEKKGEAFLNNNPKKNADISPTGLKKAKEEEDEWEEFEVELGGDELDFEDEEEEEEYERRRKRNAVSDKSMLWPDPSNIPYVISKEYTAAQREVLAAAIAQFTKYTCIRFKAKTATDKKYITFVKAGGCRATMGKSSGTNPEDQVVLLSDCCLKDPSSVEHELMHTLGFFHEHNRPDRDQFVTVHTDKIREGMAGEFEKQAKGNVQGTRYEYESVMHYAKDWFSKDGSNTLVPKDKAYLNKIGHAKGFSQTDVDEINMLYCGGKKDVTVKPLCYDNAPGCALNLDACKDSIYMKSCMKSCNQCSDPPGPLPVVDACADKDAEVCAKAASDCTSDNADLADGARYFCPKTCKVCT